MLREVDRKSRRGGAGPGSTGVQGDVTDVADLDRLFKLIGVKGSSTSSSRMPAQLNLCRSAKWMRRTLLVCSTATSKTCNSVCRKHCRCFETTDF